MYIVQNFVLGACGLRAYVNCLKYALIAKSVVSGYLVSNPKRDTELHKAFIESPYILFDGEKWFGEFHSKIHKVEDVIWSKRE